MSDDIQNSEYDDQNDGNKLIEPESIIDITKFKVIDEYKLDPEIKAKWLDYLRSGDYIQGVGELKHVKRKEGCDEYRHCCLGVLGEIITQRADEYYQKAENACQLPDLFSASRFHISNNFSRMINFPAYSEKVGLVRHIEAEEGTDEDDLEAEGKQFSLQFFLSRLNDDGYTFNQIADWIEANL